MQLPGLKIKPTFGILIVFVLLGHPGNAFAQVPKFYIKLNKQTAFALGETGIAYKVRKSSAFFFIEADGASSAVGLAMIKKKCDRQQLASKLGLPAIASDEQIVKKLKTEGFFINKPPDSTPSSIKQAKLEIDAATKINPAKSH